tara:strand:+ start:2430 stop:2726 length:297 start_codon:yes stop_codon:yes gene_type:complete
LVIINTPRPPLAPRYNTRYNAPPRRRSPHYSQSSNSRQHAPQNKRPHTHYYLCPEYVSYYIFCYYTYTHSKRQSDNHSRRRLGLGRTPGIGRPPHYPF